ncbi:hypothetical protein LINGRAHAP2_LOCUS22276 [Linum grandiflorum]
MKSCKQYQTDVIEFQGWDSNLHQIKFTVSGRHCLVVPYRLLSQR